MAHTVERQLLVAWRAPGRLAVPVGILTRSGSDGDQTFGFRYLKIAESVAGFDLLPGLGEFDRVYTSSQLFPVIANRLMSPERPDYADWLDQFGLPPEADVFDVLERSGGARVTDHVELFPFPRIESGELETRFFVRGIRHVHGGVEAARRLDVGAELTLRSEPTNPVNSAAMLLDSDTNECIGYAPDYLLDMIRELHSLNGFQPSVIVERVNRGAPPSTMVLTQMMAPCPIEYQPFSGPNYQPMVGT